MWWPFKWKTTGIVLGIDLLPSGVSSPGAAALLLDQPASGTFSANWRLLIIPWENRSSQFSGSQRSHLWPKGSIGQNPFLSLTHTSLCSQTSVASWIENRSNVGNICKSLETERTNNLIRGHMYQTSQSRSADLGSDLPCPCNLIHYDLKGKTDTLHLYSETLDIYSPKVL
jgi:hypothetical protein